MTLNRLDDGPTLYEFFRSLDKVQVLELDGKILDWFQNFLSTPGVFPGLKVIRVSVSRQNCKMALQLLAIASGLRMEEGNPLTTIEQIVAAGEDGLDQRLHAKWRKYYKAEGIQNFLSK